MIVEYLAGNQAYVLSALMNEFVYLLSERSFIANQLMFDQGVSIQ